MSHKITVAAAMALVALLACQRMKPSEDLLKEARQAHTRGENRAAVIQLKNLLQQEPGHAIARHMLGELHLALGDPASAEKELRRALSLGHPRKDVLPPLVRALLEQASYQGVLDELQAEPPTAAVLAWRGHAQFGLGKNEDAGQLYTEALRKDPDLVEAHLGQARLALVRGDADGAAGMVERALAAAPRNTQTLRFKGDLLRSRGQLEAAMTTYRAILTIDPNNVQAHADIAASLLQSGKPALARTQLAAARKLQPGSLVLVYAQALLEYAEGKHKTALEHAQMVLRAAPEHMPSYLLAATIELAIGATAQARTHVLRYRQGQPKEIYGIRLQALCDLRENKPQDALALVEPLLAAGSQDIDLLAIGGEAAMRAGKHELAGRWFALASSQAPESSQLLAANGLSLLSQGQDARAVDALEQAARQDGPASRAGALLVMTHLRTRNFAQAKAQVAAMEAQGDNPAVQNLKGGVFLVSGDPDAARRAFSRALKIDPGHMPALDNLVELDLMEKKLPQARKRYQAALERNRGNVPLMMSLARLEARTGNPAAAIAWLEQASKAAPDAAAPMQALAALYLRTGQAERALALAQRYQASRPAEAAAIDLVAQAAAAAGKHQLALASLQKLTALNPANAELFMRLARNQLALRQKAEALHSVRKAIAIEPQREEALALASALMIDSRAFDDARKLARLAQQRQPKAGIGYKLEADALLEDAKPQEALALYERAFGLQRSGPLMIALHRAMHAAGKLQEARQRMDAWLAQQPQDQPTRLYFASHLLQLGDHAAARHEYETILQNDPDNVLALNDLAWALLQLKDAGALRPAERAHRLAPANPAVADTLAWILVESGKPARAVPLLKKALESAPTSHDIRLHYAHALFRTGDKKGARSQCEQLLAVQGFALRSEVQSLIARM
ncbi:XrtA/PEP-CTERM system TPR-repeat protein PrsT [Pseudoduganella sp. OTU4001]|uniref:XrtA/PEP-CTERM system TPR-repeat protein PrsT n=1 Tax=Pseudoduganella sp. OTU4001 TaxID=3043854 RepID=UPI00313C395D